MGCLGAAFEKPRLLLGRPQESAESRLGSLFQTPYFLGGVVNVPKTHGKYGMFKYKRPNGLECFVILDIEI